ncbi:LapA family protein [Marinovum sp. 2_MG-2023]|uniref:LapA family protein n=1 Tax=unclassified Marinovum TaxID=2647166 RepID=UPI0026E1967F|nr:MULTISPECIES: LapA family protein [unclassified Marinovum]MDO6730099.1 LapA family protein [Marinovum sp. 2_MG-2023]MDO6779913.1 LapA family protein [Marinovum sp. 1_MG-2023]
MRYIKYAFLAVVGLAIIAVAVANRGLVTLTLLPPGLAELAGVNQSITLPLFAVIIAGVAAGLLIGFVWEWLREFKQRAESARKDSEIKQMKRELRRLRDEKHEGEDEVLALLDEAS